MKSSLASLGVKSPKVKETKSPKVKKLFKRYDEDGKLIFELPDGEALHTRMMYFDLKKL